MGIGISIILLVVGAIILTDAVTIPSSITNHVNADTVGWICIGVGVLGLVIAMMAGRRDTTPPA